MQNIRTIISLSIILVLFETKIYGQKTWLGPQIAIGKSEFDAHSLQLVWPFYDYYTNFFDIGIDLKYSGNKSLWASSGLSISNRSNPNSNFTYIKLPLGLDVELGNKIQFIAGGGLNLTYLIAYKIKSKYAFNGFDESKNRFQLGWQGNVGVGYKISENFKLRVLYQNNFDITSMYSLGQSSPGGAPYSIKIWSYDGFFKIVALSQLKKK